MTSTPAVSSFPRRDGRSCDLQFNRAQRAVRRKVQRFPIIAAKGDVGCLRLAVHDAAELLARRIDDVDAARAARIDVARHVDFESVGAAWFGAFQIHEDAFALIGEQPVRHHVEGADLHAPRIPDVKNLFVG
jgi:hypothetical protein